MQCFTFTYDYNLASLNREMFIFTWTYWNFPETESAHQGLLKMANSWSTQISESNAGLGIFELAGLETWGLFCLDYWTRRGGHVLARRRCVVAVRLVQIAVCGCSCQDLTQSSSAAYLKPFPLGNFLQKGPCWRFVCMETLQPSCFLLACLPAFAHGTQGKHSVSFIHGNVRCT